MEKNGGFERRFDVTTTMKLASCNNQLHSFKPFFKVNQTCLKVVLDNNGAMG